MERPTYKELVDYVEQWKMDIPVRACTDNKWQNVYLGTLTPEQIKEWILKWYEEGKLPHRVIRGKRDGTSQTTKV